MSRWLFLAGALPFVFLGTVHVLETPRRPADRRGLSPADPLVADAMTATGVRMTARTTLWLAWVGFNLSHSLGAILFGVVALLVGRSDASFAANAAVFGPLAVVVSATYVAIGLRYWFRAPITGCAVGFALFALSWALRLASEPR
jgi:hypothetical protein